MSLLYLKPGQQKQWQGSTWNLCRSNDCYQIGKIGSLSYHKINISLYLYTRGSRLISVKEYGNMEMKHNCVSLLGSNLGTNEDNEVVVCKIMQLHTDCACLPKIGNHWDGKEWHNKYDVAVHKQHTISLFDESVTVLAGLYVGKVFEVDEFTDTEVHFDDKVFHCHATVLMRRSGVWKKELTTDMTEKETRKIDAYDEHFPKEHFEAFMTALYNPTKLIDYDALALCSIYRLADKYNVQDLVKAVPKFFELAEVDQNNICEMIKLALSFNNGALFKQCLDEFPQVTEEFYQSEAWVQLVAAEPTLRFVLESLGKIERNDPDSGSGLKRLKIA